MTVHTLCLNPGQKPIIVGMITALVRKLLRFFFFFIWEHTMYMSSAIGCCQNHFFWPWAGVFTEIHDW